MLAWRKGLCSSLQGLSECVRAAVASPLALSQVPPHPGLCLWLSACLGAALTLAPLIIDPGGGRRRVTNRRGRGRGLCLRVRGKGYICSQCTSDYSM